ncbi:hypothetical protein BU15DRAFT_63280 [Melanogaster broomeanus]|nr:hypothetical protein BU15DRAFT_63280 [Melanogaster broomeanus]
MPFSTDAHWPQGLLNIFHVSRNQNVPFESRYYGPYDRLFNYAVIEGSFALFLAPQAAPDDTSTVPREAVGYGVFMVVLDQDQKPVLLAEVKDDKWANRPDTRQRADAQMRRWYDQMLQHCPIPRLYGLSLLGTSLRVYCGDKATGKVAPGFVGRPDAGRILPPDFLGGEWGLDILSQDGLKKMQEIVAYVKAEVANVMG